MSASRRKSRKEQVFFSLRGRQFFFVKHITLLMTGSLVVSMIHCYTTGLRFVSVPVQGSFSGVNKMGIKCAWQVNAKGSASG